jgi:hypothetical protein
MIRIPRTRSMGAATSLLSMGLLCGCDMKVLTPSPADRLREENDRLQAEVDGLRMRLVESESKLAMIGAEASFVPSDREALAAAPRLSSISIASSSVLRLGADGRGTLLVRLVPGDGRGRFMQITGWVSIRSSMLDRRSPPSLIGERSFSPGEVRDAWRSGFGGSVYLFEVPVVVPEVAEEFQEATVLATFRDAIGGGEFSRHGLVPVDRDVQDVPDVQDVQDVQEGGRSR